MLNQLSSFYLGNIMDEQPKRGRKKSEKPSTAALKKREQRARKKTGESKPSGRPKKKARSMSRGRSKSITATRPADKPIKVEIEVKQPPKAPTQARGRSKSRGRTTPSVPAQVPVAPPVVVQAPPIDEPILALTGLQKETQNTIAQTLQMQQEQIARGQEIFQLLGKATESGFQSAKDRFESIEQKISDIPEQTTQRAQFILQGGSRVDNLNPSYRKPNFNEPVEITEPPALPIPPTNLRDYSEDVKSSIENFNMGKQDFPAETERLSRETSGFVGNDFHRTGEVGKEFKMTRTLTTSDDPVGEKSAEDYLKSVKASVPHKIDEPIKEIKERVKQKVLDKDDRYLNTKKIFKSLKVLGKPTISNEMSRKLIDELQEMEDTGNTPVFDKDMKRLLKKARSKMSAIEQGMKGDTTEEESPSDEEELDKRFRLTSQVFKEVGISKKEQQFTIEEARELLDKLDELEQKERLYLNSPMRKIVKKARKMVQREPIKIKEQFIDITDLPKPTTKSRKQLQMERRQRMLSAAMSPSETEEEVKPSVPIREAEPVKKSEPKPTLDKPKPALDEPIMREATKAEQEEAEEAEEEEAELAIVYPKVNKDEVINFIDKDVEKTTALSLDEFDAKALKKYLEDYGNEEALISLLAFTDTEWKDTINPDLPNNWGQLRRIAERLKKVKLFNNIVKSWKELNDDDVIESLGLNAYAQKL